jgi:hypothetical protein
MIILSSYWYNRLELRTLLNSFDWNFDEETRKKVMLLFDVDLSGKKFVIYW